MNSTADRLTKKVYLLSPIIIGNRNKSFSNPCMYNPYLLDDDTHQSRLLVELMTHMQCESKPIANKRESLLPIVTNGYNFLSKLTFLLQLLPMVIPGTHLHVIYLHDTPYYSYNGSTLLLSLDIQWKILYLALTCTKISIYNVLAYNSALNPSHNC